MRNSFEINRRKGQVTIFIIIAILIVAGLVGYYLLIGRVKPTIFPKETLPVYEYFLSCVEDETKLAASLMGSQAGYLEVPEFEIGSEYYPSSSHLDFLGYSVPYWYYVSSQGIAKEQVPSKEKMQEQLEEHLEERIEECDFSDFERKGFVIERGEIKVEAYIMEEKIEVETEMPLTINFGGIVGRQTQHTVSVNSRLGRFYDLARGIYGKERDDLFLEHYGVDVLRLYAPVDGVEISCSPKVWLQSEIKEELESALEGNVQAIKIKGDYYSLGAEDKGYFVQDIGEEVGEESSVNFLYSKQWPTKIEIYAEDPILANPVGLEEGLGILGFCYVPYHFVYDMAYPVLIQIYGVEEMFQFPIAVIIDKNKPIEGLDVEALPQVVPELCEHKLTEINVYTYNTKLDPVEASISFKCFDTACDIGRTGMVDGDAYLKEKFPQCVNGFVIAKAEGYSVKKQILSTVESTTANIVLDKEHNLSLDVTSDGESLDGEMAIIYFRGEHSFTVAYPEQKEVRLSEGQYEITVYIYKNSSISFAGSTTRKCLDVPEPGLLGLFGVEKEQCYDIEIPPQTITSAIAGGGKTNYYMIESELENAGKLEIKAESLPAPSSLEQLQDNYNLLEEKSLWLEFS